QRKQVKVSPRAWIDAVGRNDAVRETRPLIVSTRLRALRRRLAQIGCRNLCRIRKKLRVENALALQQCGHSDLARILRTQFTLLLLGEKEEQLLLVARNDFRDIHRPTQINACGYEAIGWIFKGSVGINIVVGLGKGVECIKYIVALIPIQRPVILTPSSFSNRLNGCAGFTAKLGLIETALHLDLRNSIHTDEGVVVAAIGVFDGYTVNGDIVLPCTPTVHVEGGVATKTLGFGPGIVDHAWLQRRQHGKLTVDDSEVLHLLAGDDTRTLATGSLHGGALGHHLYRFAGFAQLQLDAPR